MRDMRRGLDRSASGMTPAPFLIGDALRLGLAALVVPGVRKLLGCVRVRTVS